MRREPLVLYVDDDPIGREVLEAMLSDDGYALAEASDGTEALAKIMSLVPDVVLLDVNMPGLDGFEVVRRVRADAAVAEIPIILVTALDDRASRLRGLDAGADDFITKPIDRAELRARVRTVTRLDRFRGLLAERARLEWAVETADDGFLIVDGADHISSANPRARFFLGLLETPSTATFSDLTRRHYRREPDDVWETWPQDPRAARYLVRPETDQAPALWLQVDAFEPEGRSEGRLVRLRDVTDRIKARREMWAFHSAINHKLRTPLTSLVPSLEFLAAEGDKLPGPTIQKLAAAALRGAQRLQTQLTDILEYVDATRVHWGGDGFPSEDIPALAGEVASRAGIPAPLLRSGVGPGRVGLSRRALEMIFAELLDNARKFHGKGTPQTELELAPAGEGRISVSLLDDGLVMSPDQIGRAFRPYYQGERDHTGQLAGMGLGLSMVATIVWSVDGAVRIANRTDATGVKVELVLPFQPEG